MNKFLNFIIFLTVLSIAFVSVPKFKAEASDFNSTTVSEIVMEKNSKRVLYQNNIHEKKYMASTTKILTAIVVIENCDLQEIVTVDKKTTGIEGSSIYLEAGERLSVKDLLFGLMLRSGNDCAETLAVHCAGSIEKFVELMNQTALRIGAKNSNFINPHGLHNDNHYTTAYDLALISCYAIQNKTFKDIVSTQKTDIPFTTHNTKRHLVNKNKMLREFDGATGIKTGFTKKAGRCLVSSCERDGMELVSVVLNCGPMFERSKSLMTNAFDEYKLYNLVESDNIAGFVSVENSGELRGVHLKQDIVLPLSAEEKNEIFIEYIIPKTIDKNVPKDSEIGLIKIYCKNNLIFTEKLFTII